MVGVVDIVIYNSQCCWLDVKVKASFSMVTHAFWHLFNSLKSSPLGVIVHLYFSYYITPIPWSLASAFRTKRWSKSGAFHTGSVHSTFLISSNAFWHLSDHLDLFRFFKRSLNGRAISAKFIQNLLYYPASHRNILISLIFKGWIFLYTLSFLCYLGWFCHILQHDQDIPTQLGRMYFLPNLLWVRLSSIFTKNSLIVFTRSSQLSL